MAIYVDTADVEEAREAFTMGWIKGITTNPLLFGQSKREPEGLIKELAEISKGPFFYQLRGSDKESMSAEMHRVSEIVGERLVIKIPATPLGFRAVDHFADYADCCVTAVYTVAQAVIAAEVGAKYVAVYVNRATARLGDGILLLQNIAKALEGSQMKVLAASLKSVEEAGEALLVGADHLTISYKYLKDLPCHPLTEEAVKEFDSRGAGL